MEMIRVNNIHKKFKLYYDKGQSLKEKILFRNRNYYEDRYVLKGISFKVSKGEAIGIIGENGCGKSTLLKLMTQIMYSTQGSIEIKGRVSSLIELGAGFHPDMSGRENIYTNASIFGLSKQEINNRLDTIINFSELEDFIDNPVRTYSSGMYMRLAFSVAINVDADVLLIDEILAVGDANFQAKCFDKLREIKAGGTTIVIVSHSLGQIEQICERSLWIKDGIIEKIGSPRSVHAEYLQAMGEKRQINLEQKELEMTSIDPPHKEEKPQEQQELQEQQVDQGDIVKLVHSVHRESKGRWGDKRVEITNVELLDFNGKKTYSFKTGDPITIHISYKAKIPGLFANMGIGVFRNDGLHCYGTNTLIEYNQLIDVGTGGTVQVQLENNNLLDGEYLLDVAMHTDNGFPYDDIKGIKTFLMTSGRGDNGVCRLTAHWSVNGHSLSAPNQ